MVSFGDSTVILFFFFKQKTAYEMRISDWSSDVCSSDLIGLDRVPRRQRGGDRLDQFGPARRDEHPASFLAPLGEPRVAQDFHMPADARLALPQHLRKLAHRQLHRA